MPVKRPSVETKKRSWSSEERRVRLDALLLWWPYTGGSLRATIEQLLEEARAEAWNEANEQQMLVCAAATWPARLAVRRFAQTYPDLVWERLLVRCLPTTQVLLKRVAEQEGTTDFFALLASPAADFALHESERLELELLLPQIYALLWRDCHAQMSAELEVAKALRDEKRALFPNPTTDPRALSLFDHEMMYGEEE